MSHCPRVDEAILLHLRQLTPNEERAYEDHLKGCLACRLKSAEIADTLDLLPLAAPAVVPPPDLKGKVMARISAVDAATPARQAGFRRRWLVPAGVAAAVLALVVGSYALVKIQTLQQQLAALQRPVSAVERDVAMVGTADAPGATGRLVAAREGGGTRITLQTKGLPALDPGEVYQVWLIRDGKSKSAGLFVVDGTGNGAMSTWLPEGVQFDTVGITCEPDAFGPEPRGDRMMHSV